MMVDAETNSMSSEFVTDDTAQILPEGVGSGEQPESAPEHHHAPHKEEVCTWSSYFCVVYLRCAGEANERP